MKKLSNLPKIIVILGPTATGKSDMAVNCSLFLKNHGKKSIESEIISADSRQTYRGLDIGAGKITKKEMQSVPHHGLDIVSPARTKQYSVAEFQAYADKKIANIVARGAVPIICGGTGFYIDAVVDGIILPEVPPNKKLRTKLANKTADQLFTILLKLDKKRAAEIDKQNPVRLIRAIEIAKTLGKVPKMKIAPKYKSLIIGLDLDDATLKEKVVRRIDARLVPGNNMIDEAKRLHKNSLSWKRMRQFGLEYGLLADLLQEKISLEEFKTRLAFDIWHYVKRQRAWFKRRDDVNWIDPSKKSDFKKMYSLIANFLKN